MCFQKRVKQGPFYGDWYEKLSCGGEAMLNNDFKVNYFQCRDYLTCMFPLSITPDNDKGTWLKHIIDELKNIIIVEIQDLCDSYY